MTGNLYAAAGAALALLAATSVLAGPALAAPTPAQKCQSGKNAEAGKYAYCRHKADAKFALKGDTAARDAAFLRCVDKYERKWASLELKAAGACAGGNDGSAMQAFIDTHTATVAAALAGGPLPDCPGDVALCESDLTTCTDDLGTCSSALAPCLTDLPACQDDLATAQADLTTCTGDLATCTDDLADCEGGSGGGGAQRLQTGQFECWNADGVVIPCAGTGHDGQFQAGVARAYVDNGNGTITDTSTGLMWEKLSNDGSVHDKDNRYTWANAVAVKIATLNAEAFGGFTNWRLPNINELSSILDYNRSFPGVNPVFNAPSCPTGCTVLTCSCIMSNFDSWSSTTHLITPANALTVSFSGGLTNARAKTGNNYVRAVRGGN